MLRWFLVGHNSIGPAGRKCCVRLRISMHDLRNRLAVVCGSGEGSAFGYAKVESLADIGPLAHCIDGMVETLLTSKTR